jgi:hypothetical protein
VSHEPETELVHREAELLRWLRLEQVPQGLPEYHNPSRPLSAAEGALNRRRLAAAAGTADGYTATGEDQGTVHAAELAAEIAADHRRRRHLRAVGE